MDSITKSQHGQFYTTQYETIFDGFTLQKSLLNKVDFIIEPFVGNGDLIKFLYETSHDIVSDKKLVCNDLFLDEATSNKIKSWFPNSKLFQEDLFDSSHSFKDSFVITNPPFLAKNKSIGDKSHFKKWDCDDLYKCFLNMILSENNQPHSGILITPLNFWCSYRKRDVSLRKRFLSTYQIFRLNIFMGKVFEDTTSTITSFYFMRRATPITYISDIDTYWYSSPIHKKNINLRFDDMNHYTIGGDIYTLPKHSPNWKVWRITQRDVILNKSKYFTHILVKCIDDSESNQIHLTVVKNIEDIYIDDTSNYTARSYCSLAIDPIVNSELQQQLVKLVNKFLNTYRSKYHSLFLSNYRESKNGFGRKRLSFDLLYRIVLHILETNSIFKNNTK